MVATQTTGQPAIAPAAGAESSAAQRREPAPPLASPWLSPIRLTALALAVLAAALLIGSLVLSRMSRASARTGARPQR
jgi:hypothetical protein